MVKIWRDIMGKYAPLKEFLTGQNQDYVPMTFAQIEKVLDLKLPPSKQYPAWWSNNPSNNPMTREWLDAGFETMSVNIEGREAGLSSRPEECAASSREQIFRCGRR